MMRIGVAKRGVRAKYGTGVDRYATRLSASLIEEGAQVERLTDGESRSWVRRAASAVGSSNAQASKTPTGWVADDVFRAAQTCFTVTGRFLDVTLEDPPTLFHWAHPVPMRISNCRNVYTIHDLLPVTHQELTGIPSRRFERIIAEIGRSADAIVTVSETVADHVRNALPGCTAPITCAYTPIDPIKTAAALPMHLQPQGYFLAIGRVETRKNIVRLIEAHRKSGVERPLLIVGPDGHWASRAERRLVEMAADGARVIRINWVSDDVADALIKNAFAILQPSLAEGFGLPVVEAMANGVPALSTLRPPGPEIAGDAAMLVDPLDTAGLANAISQLESDAELRAALIHKGHIRAAEFSAKHFASKLLSVYQRAIRE